MKFCARSFNLYLTLAVALAFVTSCATSKKDEHVAALRVHIERPLIGVGSGQTVKVMRDQPVEVNIAGEPILTEQDVTAARIIDSPGGFAVELKFDETSSWILEQNTAASPGAHLVIFGQWSDKVSDGRWLAAPLITHRIADGILTFTPDATREEMEQLILGLNETAKKNAKK
jgi:hypothetical protein